MALGSATRTSEPASARALLAVVVPAMLLMVIAADMVNLVLPAIGDDFGASEAQLAWVVTGFLLVFSVGVPFYGRVSDRFGLRRLFTVALLTYVAGSLVCALAPGLAVLVVGRLVTGAGAAAIPVLSVVAVTRALPADRRGTGIGFVGVAGGVGTALGPAVGGVVGQLLGWRGLFWLTLVAALALLPGVRSVVPDDAPGDDRRFDLAGGILLGLGAGLLLFGVTQAQVAGFASPSSWGILLAAGGAVAAFWWRTVAARDPFVPPALFANRGYVAAVVTVFLTMSSYLATLVFVPVLVVEVDDLSPGSGSLVMIPGGIAVAVLAPLAGRFVGPHRLRPLAVTALVVNSASILFLSTYAGTSVVLTAVGVLLLSCGFAVAITVLTLAATLALPGRHAGTGLGIFQAAQFLGAGTGPAVVGVVLAARRATTDAVNPFHAGAAPAFSDAFTVLTVVAALGGLAALFLVHGSTFGESEDRG